MDCPVEEREIRQVLENVPGIESLRFQLAARTLGITAPDDTLTQALEAIRAAGFDPKPVSARAAVQVVAAALQAQAGNACCSRHDHCGDNKAAAEHQHAQAHPSSAGDLMSMRTSASGLTRLIAALRW